VKLVDKLSEQREIRRKCRYFSPIRLVKNIK